MPQTGAKGGEHINIKSVGEYPKGKGPQDDFSGERRYGGQEQNQVGKSRGKKRETNFRQEFTRKKTKKQEVCLWSHCENRRTTPQRDRSVT